MVAAALRADATAFRPQPSMDASHTLRAGAAVFEPPSAERLAAMASGTLSAEAAVFEPAPSLRADAAVFEPFDASIAAKELRAEAAVFEPPRSRLLSLTASKGSWEEADGVQWPCSSPASTAASHHPSFASYSDGAPATQFSGNSASYVSSPWASPWGSTRGDDCAGPSTFALPDAYGFDASSLQCTEQQHLDMGPALATKELDLKDEEDRQFKLEGMGSLRDSLMALLDSEGADGAEDAARQQMQKEQEFKLEGIANFEKSLASILGQMLPTSGEVLER